MVVEIREGTVTWELIVISLHARGYNWLCVGFTYVRWVLGLLLGLLNECEPNAMHPLVTKELGAMYSLRVRSQAPWS